MPDPITWTPAEVAAALGRSLDWYYRNITRLRAAGFPAPLPIVRRYDPAAVRRWIAAAAGAPPAAGEISPATDDAEAWAAQLDRNAAALGRQLARA